MIAVPGSVPAIDRLRLVAVGQLVRTDRFIARATCSLQALVRGASRIAVPPRLHAEVTRRIFDSSRGWGAGGHEFEKQLFSWEEEFVQAAVPEPGLVLVGGVGGGRELRGLADLGHDVIAFEPSDLVLSARKVAAELLLAPVHRASYADLLEAVRGDGALAGLPYDRVDAVVLGWGSICHLTARTERIAALSPLRTLMPAVSVLYSFNFRGADRQPYSDRRRLRFDPNLGYFAALQWPDVEQEATAAGYTVTRAHLEPAAYAWLSPR